MFRQVSGISAFLSPLASLLVKNRAAFQETSSGRCYSRVRWDVSIQAPVLTPCSVSALSEAFSFAHPLLLPLWLCPGFFLLAPWFSQLVSFFPRLSTLFISLSRSLSLCLPPLSLSCHPPSSLPIRICGAGDQSQRDVFSSTAAITQNSISPILK